MQNIATKEAPEALGPYSQAVVSGDMIFVSGQLPLDPESGIIPDGIEAQTARALENVRAILCAAGSDLNEVVKVTVYMQDLTEFSAMNACYATYFTAPYPARAALQAAALPKGAKLEIDVIAMKGRSESEG